MEQRPKEKQAHILQWHKITDSPQQNAQREKCND